jgi:hypothetical protein
MKVRSSCPQRHRCDAFETIRLNRPGPPLPGLLISIAEVADERCRLSSEFICGRDYRLSGRHGLQGA